MTKSRLVEKTFESMNQDERPPYFERLLGELSSEEQQAFLLKLALRTAGVEAMLAGEEREAVKLIQQELL